jgi:hypothetical protein
VSYPQEHNKAYLLDRYYKQRRSFFEYLGQFNCVQCGSEEELQFDHIDPRNKLFTIGKLWPTKFLPLVFKELDKCQVLCKPCHDKKSAKQHSQRILDIGFSHGTIYGFMKKKCKCESCIKRQQEWYGIRNKARRTNGAREPYNQPSPHGTRKTYHRGCKCSLCRAANAKHVREIKLNKN